MRLLQRNVRAVVVLLSLLVAALATAAPTKDETVPLYRNLGSHHFPITTQVPDAQRYFDQGMRLTYAFNHQEAIASFAQATRLDPDCAMCYWGIALAYGPNINMPMAPEAVKPAVAALERAQTLADKASPREQAYIRALAERYEDPAPADRAELDRAYADAMAEVVAKFPDDLDAATLYAEALMDLSPWDYWDGKQPKPDTEILLGQLGRVIKANPNHPGACHYYIHAVESVYPERAIDCADRLADLMPGAGHLVHMPAHIYARVGRWNDAIEANRHAVHADEEFIADRGMTGIYPSLYYPHNYHFLSFAAFMSGRDELSLDAATKLSEQVNADVARKVPELQGMVPYRQLMLVGFEQWDEVLAAPLPPEDLPLAHGLGQYARGMALAAGGKNDEARAALDAVRNAAGNIEGEPWESMIRIAELSLDAEIAAKEGRTDDAVSQLREAVALEDGLPYMEPPYWYRPVRHDLARVLLDAGEAKQAEQAYREDLERFPDNGWSLDGLATSLQAQGEGQEAERIRARLQQVTGEEGVATLAD